MENVINLPGEVKRKSGTKMSKKYDIAIEPKKAKYYIVGTPETYRDWYYFFRNQGYNIRQSQELALKRAPK